MLTRRRFVELGLSAAGTSTALSGAPAQTLTPDQVARELLQGNRRFVSGHPRHPHSSLAWAKRAGKEGQHPHAVVLCCSDSRVSPEIIFDQGIGDLFVVRVAGNVAQDDEIGSIEYAVEHLHIPLCVVLGHTGCGAVSAVVSGEKLPKEIEHLVAPIQQAHTKAMKLYPQLKGAALIQATVRLNVLETCATLANGRTPLRAAIEHGHLRVDGAMYDLATGRATWIQSDGKLPDKR